jgi:hypothetical protein
VPVQVSSERSPAGGMKLRGESARNLPSAGRQGLSMGGAGSIDSPGVCPGGLCSWRGRRARPGECPAIRVPDQPSRAVHGLLPPARAVLSDTSACHAFPPPEIYLAMPGVTDACRDSDSTCRSSVSARSHMDGPQAPTACADPVQPDTFPLPFGQPCSDPAAQLAPESHPHGEGGRAQAAWPGPAPGAGVRVGVPADPCLPRLFASP